MVSVGEFSTLFEPEDRPSAMRQHEEIYGILPQAGLPSLT
jgi:hypothetical protein